MSRFSAYNLVCSFLCAIRGVVRSFWYERNLRIHSFAAAYVLYFSKYFSLSNTQYAVVFICIGLVIASELINTAIEASVDLYAPAYSELAKTAKDAAAGAVLATSAASAAAGVCFFWKPDIIRLIWLDMLGAPAVWLFLIAITIFIISWPETHQAANGTGKNHII